MRIDFKNLYGIIPQKNNREKVTYKTSPIKADTFEKSSNISFGNFSPFDSFIFIKPYQAMQETQDEIDMSQYIEILLYKDIRKLLLVLIKKRTTLEELNSFFKASHVDIDNVNKIFKQAGIKSVNDVKLFIDYYTSNSNIPKIYKEQNVEAVKIFGILGRKSDLRDFPELALNIYQELENTPEPDFDIINNYFDILKALGVEKESDIDEKFNYLKPKFNNFETLSDKFNAINYIVKTFNGKIQMIDDIIKDSQTLSDEDSFDIYLKISDIVNYLYEKNDGKNLGDLSFFIDIAVSADKIKHQKRAEELFGSFSDIGNKIEFYTLLKKCNIPVSEFNALVKPAVVSDLSLLDILVYKQTITDELKTTGKVSNQKIEEIYKNLYPVITAVYTRGDNQEDSESLNTVLKLIDKYKIKTQNDFLNFYNKVYKTKENKLTIEKTCTLVDLLKFDDEINILETAKKSNTTPKLLLEEKKEKFDAREQEINNFLETTSHQPLLGKTAFDIYKEHPFLSDVKPENIYETLELALTTGINENNGQYAEAEFAKFASLFPSKKDALSFVINNKIKFDTSDDAANYRNACLDIVQSIYEDMPPEVFLNKMQKLSRLGFLSKSRQSLPDFVSEMKSSGLLKEISNSVIDNEIASVRLLNNFLKKYETHPGNHSNLIKHILTIPEDISFNTYTDFINRLNERIKSYQVNTSINDDNILNIDINKYFNKKSYSINDINELLCAVLGKENSDASFISLLNESYITGHEEYSPYTIAKEIANRIDSTDESYQNISKELKLDRTSLGLDNDCSKYTYTKAIEGKLPSELIDFVNSDDWLDFNDNGQISNMTLHAKLRLTDRFALSDNNGIKNLNTDSTKLLLKDILKSIYTKIPKQIEGQSESKRILIQTEYNNQTIEAVFNGDGKLITVMNIN